MGYFDVSLQKEPWEPSFGVLFSSQVDLQATDIEKPITQAEPNQQECAQLAVEGESGYTTKYKFECLPPELLVQVALFTVENSNSISQLALTCKQVASALVQNEETLFHHIVQIKLQCDWDRSLRPILFHDKKEKRGSPRVRKEIHSGRTWKALAECLDIASESPIDFRGFFTDGGHDESMEGIHMRRRHWAGNAFRPDSSSFYCSDGSENILLCAALHSSTTQSQGVCRRPEVEKECFLEWRGQLRRASMLNCLKGSCYDLATRPQALSRASTSELERMFVEIVANPSGLDLLVSSKFGWYGLPFFFGTSSASREQFRSGLRSLAAKIMHEQNVQLNKDIVAVAEGARRQCRVLFDSVHSLDYKDRVAVKTDVVDRFLRAKALSEFALIDRIVVEREGNFTCPVNVGAVFVAMDVLPTTRHQTGVTDRLEVVLAKQLAEEVHQDVSECVKEDEMVKALDSVKDLERVEKLSAAKLLPPISAVHRENGVQVVEFEPKGLKGERRSGLQVVAWFRFEDGCPETRLELKLRHTRVGRFLMAKLISSEDRMNLFGQVQQAPNIDCSGIYAFGRVVQLQPL